MELRADAKNRTDFFRTQNGDKLETVVLDWMRSLAADFDISPEDIRHTPKQHFPDILLGNHFGVEVKSTKENTWQSTGSSIVESLREEQVKKVFLMFGKLSDTTIDFRCKPYEECLYDISVTHSPRYLINMDLPNEEHTIFSKMHVEYETFRNCDNQISIVRKYYREKFRTGERRGSMPWWIGDETTSSDFRYPALNDTGEIRMLNSLDSATQSYLILCAFVLFPEVLGRGLAKFNKFSMWLCSRHSIICSNIRDWFTAGGKGRVHVNGELMWEGVPQAICRFLMRIEDVKSVFEESSGVFDEIDYYSDYFTTREQNFINWKKYVDLYLNGQDVSPSMRIEELLKLKFESQTRNDFYFSR